MLLLKKGVSELKDVLTGLVIVLVVLLIGDFIYSEDNTCVRSEKEHIGEFCKCGLLKNKFDISIYIFDRYW